MLSAGKRPSAVALAGRLAGQDFDALVDAGDRDRPEAAGGAGLDHVLAQHQVLDVGDRDQHALLAGQPARAADVEEALDLLVDPADRLHLAVLVDRAGDRERLRIGTSDSADSSA
jgi:hypothetical protein